MVLTVVKVKSGNLLSESKRHRVAELYNAFQSQGEGNQANGGRVICTDPHPDLRREGKIEALPGAMNLIAPTILITDEESACSRRMRRKVRDRSRRLPGAGASAI